MAEASEKSPPVLPVNYIKASQFREVSCDGVVGGVTAKNKVWMGVFSERFPLPRVVIYKGETIPGAEDRMNVDETAEPVFVESRQGIVRNVEVGIFLDLEAAEKMVAWLTDRVSELKSSVK